MPKFSKRNKTLIVAAIAASAATLILIAGSLFQILTAVMSRNILEVSGYPWTGDLVSGFLLPLGAAIVVCFALAVIWPLRKGATPFTKRNVYLIRSAGLTVFLLEPLHYFVQAVLNHLRPLSESGIKTTYFTGFGGIFISLGLIILSISCVFAYGVTLQKESDETL